MSNKTLPLLKFDDFYLDIEERCLTFQTVSRLVKRRGNLFVVLRRGKPFSLWKLPLNGSQPEQLREGENDAIFRLAISRKGERVFYEVGNQLNSVVQFQSLDSERKAPPSQPLIIRFVFAFFTPSMIFNICHKKGRFRDR